MGFRLVSKSVTLNDLERRNGHYFALFTELGSFRGQLRTRRTRNSLGDEVANVNFPYDDIVNALENTMDSRINSATDRLLEHSFTKFSEITQCNGRYAVHGHLRSPILVPIASS